MRFKGIEGDIEVVRIKTLPYLVSYVDRFAKILSEGKAIRLTYSLYQRVYQTLIRHNISFHISRRKRYTYILPCINQTK